ncbi:hypothetical protein SR1949_06170 [Sphaerospermopsis reniformis]|uniref:Uncharacterized protein n=1 Tax=Sphaerospermopsis reniformis TaxID=531300 RepID=A0A479ZWH5_9CYAN|nr:hypothetical protein [Sphaerospermopsis reniformis]GCL35521.1 hypothetical protein SR1949_06170 [Sphaerospermopsis reniformis]
MTNENICSDNNNENSHVITLISDMSIDESHLLVSQWSSYSPVHIYSAFYFAKMSKYIEEKYQKDCVTQQQQDIITIKNQYVNQNRSCVTSAIFSAVAFLEATINELFSEIGELLDGHYAKQLDSDTKSKIELLWKIDNLIQGKCTLEKFQIFLSAAGKEMLDKGSSHYQDVEKLITIRNVLIHYKPQMMVIGSSIESIPTTKKFNGLNFHQLELENKFPQNPLFEEYNPYFPDRCLGYGCAQWAANSSVKFVKKFYNKLGVEPHPALDTYGNIADFPGIICP